MHNSSLEEMFFSKQINRLRTSFVNIDCYIDVFYIQYVMVILYTNHKKMAITTKANQRDIATMLSGH